MGAVGGANGAVGGAMGAVRLKKGKRAFTKEGLLLEAVKETEPENERWLLGRKRSQAEKEDKESPTLSGGDGHNNDKVIEKFVSQCSYLTTITNTLNAFDESSPTSFLLLLLLSGSSLPTPASPMQPSFFRSQQSL